MPSVSDRPGGTGGAAVAVAAQDSTGAAVATIDSSSVDLTTGEIFEETLIEEVSIDGMCGVY